MLLRRGENKKTWRERENGNHHYSLWRQQRRRRKKKNGEKELWTSFTWWTYIRTPAGPTSAPSVLLLRLAGNNRKWPSPSHKEFSLLLLLLLLLFCACVTSLFSLYLSILYIYISQREGKKITNSTMIGEEEEDYEEGSFIYILNINITFLWDWRDSLSFFLFVYVDIFFWPG